LRVASRKTAWRTVASPSQSLAEWNAFEVTLGFALPTVTQNRNSGK
jgi:hypothetical protein